ncbi:hypothetical protein [Epilithonimonas sp.]|uniref:hypothetical protein n=1 Tax=Epilithonimonas sp. TaxID=2894511 RepID=UPI0035ADB09D
MTTLDNSIGQTIVGFKTGRGGRFFNAGHVSFIGECKISDFTNDLFLQYENQIDIYNKVKGRENLEAKYYECDENDDFSFFEKLGFKIGEKQYFRNGEYPVGLTEKEAESGVGVIDIDGEYDTIACLMLEDCSEAQLQLIVDSEELPGYYASLDVIEYAKEALGLDESEEEEY